MVLFTFVEQTHGHPLVDINILYRGLNLNILYVINRNMMFWLYRFYANELQQVLRNPEKYGGRDVEILKVIQNWFKGPNGDGKLSVKDTDDFAQLLLVGGVVLLNPSNQICCKCFDEQDERFTNSV